jgi:hypothetical protein
MSEKTRILSYIKKVKSIRNDYDLHFWCFLIVLVFKTALSELLFAIVLCLFHQKRKRRKQTMKIVSYENGSRWGRVIFSKEDYERLGRRIDAAYKPNPEKELEKVKALELTEQAREK